LTRRKGFCSAGGAEIQKRKQRTIKMNDREKRKLINAFEKLQKKYGKKLVLTGRDVTLLGTKTQFLHVFDFWDMIREMQKIIEDA
jgi:hypothetical protein